MILHIARVIFILLEVLILFNLLIVVHELGHFLAARWRGLYVEKFGVWFGKPIWKKTINGVQYSLGSLPFGGFVALPQLAPMDIIEGKADLDRAKLPKISALDKIIVAVAGPVFSLLLALFFAGIVWAVGHPVSEGDSTTVIGYVMPGSPAEKAGLQPGDKILSVDGKPVRRFMGMNDSVSGEVPARRRRANGVGRTLQSRDSRLAKKKCAAVAHLPGRNTDHRESGTEKPCSGSRAAPGRYHPWV
jgi:regulator of sigma E protease